MPCATGLNTSKWNATKRSSPMSMKATAVMMMARRRFMGLLRKNGILPNYDGWDAFIFYLLLANYDSDAVVVVVAEGLYGVTLCVGGNAASLNAFLDEFPCN